MRGNAGELLDEMSAGAAREISRSAAENLDSTHFQEFARGELDAADVCSVEARLESTAQRAPHRIGLFGDFFPHEMFEGSFVESISAPVDRRWRLRGRAAI